MTTATEAKAHPGLKLQTPIEVKATARLQAQVERLTKHGDAMAQALEEEGFNDVVRLWHAAKQGKQP